MNRQQKEAVVSELKDKLSASQATFLIGYKGLDVASMQTLRRGLRDADGELKVTKARLMKIAANDVDGMQNFADSFKDQVGLVFANSEVLAVAKTLATFAKEHKALDLVSGFFEAKVMSKAQIDYLASLPSKEGLLALLMGTLQAPVGNFARLLNMMIVRLLIVLKQISEKGS
jgi:large subunit ribosomal protein L10